MKNKLVQIDFYPNGETVRWYDNGNADTETSTFKPESPKEALQRRLEEYKKSKEK